MQILDPKFRTHKCMFIVQCALATLIIFIVLMILDVIMNAAVIGALGASSFIAFTMPHHNVSRTRFLVGGYAVGILVGILCHYISLWPLLADIPVFEESSHVIFGAVSVGLSIFLMVVFNFEHPPAAGLALLVLWLMRRVKS